MVMADDHPSNELESREPTVEDLRDLCPFRHENFTHRAQASGP